MKQPDPNELNSLLNLYDRGLISKKTIHKQLGIDGEDGEESSLSKYDDIDIKCKKIENARRNVEALSRININNYTNDIVNKINASMFANMAIMNEVNNIK